MKKKIALVLVLSILLTTVFTACGNGGANSSSAPGTTSDTASKPAAASDGYLNVSMGDEENPTTFDVQRTSNYYGVPLNIFDRLVETETVGTESKIVPGLAKTWDVSTDGLVYTFHLNQGVKFSNGEELKADDVVYTINRMMNPNTKAENTDVFNMIKGAQDVYDGKAQTVSGVKAIDEYTVEITLNSAFAPFLANMAVPGASIYNRKATEAAGDKFGIDPASTVGTGPFIAKSWTVNSEIVMVKNPNYFKGAPKLEGVRFKIVTDANTAKMMFENGELDIFDTADARSQISYFKASEKWKNNIVTGPIAGVYYYTFNEAVKPLDDVKVRKAIQMAIDRKSILDQMYDGEGVIANTIVPSDILGYNKDAKEIKYDVAGAKQLLADAGYPNGFDLEIYQSTANGPDTLQCNQVVQAMLGQIGIKVKINQLDDATYLAKRKDGGLSMYRSNWSADYNDPDNFLYTFFSAKNIKVRSINYTNTQVMNDLEKARTMVDQDARMKLYQSSEQTILQDDAMFLPLFQLNHIFVVSNSVKNFHVSWNGWSSMSYYGVSMG